MTRTLILLHRWLGVAFCLFFAMWFATGIVMHFVPFPALTEAERFGGLAPIDVRAIRHGPAEAVAASALKDAERVRLLQRSDGADLSGVGIIGFQSTLRRRPVERCSHIGAARARHRDRPRPPTRARCIAGNGRGAGTLRSMDRAQRPRPAPAALSDRAP